MYVLGWGVFKWVTLMRLLHLLEAVLRRLFKKTESKQSTSEVRGASFIWDRRPWRREDLHPWDVTPWIDTVPSASVGCTDVDHCLDQCSCPSFGLIDIGCSWGKLQEREDHSSMLQSPEDNFYQTCWNTVEGRNHPVSIERSVSTLELTSLRILCGDLAVSIGILFDSKYRILEHTAPHFYETKLDNLFSIWAKINFYIQFGICWFTMTFVTFF